MTPAKAIKLPDKPEQIETPLRTLLAERQTDPGNHAPTETSRKGVLHAAAFGIEHKHIAMIAGITQEQLQELYAEELEIGRPLLMNDLETNLYNIGVDRFHKDSMRASTWLLERIGGERYVPRTRAEITGANGGALQVDHRTQTVDPALLNPDQRDALRQIMVSALQLAQPQTVIEGHYEEAQGAEDLLG